VLVRALTACWCWKFGIDLTERKKNNESEKIVNLQSKDNFCSIIYPKDDVQVQT
jgi:hypothetical protein